MIQWDFSRGDFSFLQSPEITRLQTLLLNANVLPREALWEEGLLIDFCRQRGNVTQNGWMGEVVGLGAVERALWVNHLLCKSNNWSYCNHWWTG